MDMMHLPLISYFVNWHNVRGIVMFGVIGTLVFTTVGVVLWYQMKEMGSDD
jgi:hypothetical protein